MVIFLKISLKFRLTFLCIFYFKLRESYCADLQLYKKSITLDNAITSNRSLIPNDTAFKTFEKGLSLHGVLCNASRKSTDKKCDTNNRSISTTSTNSSKIQLYHKLGRQVKLPSSSSNKRLKECGKEGQDIFDCCENFNSCFPVEFKLQ